MKKSVDVFNVKGEKIEALNLNPEVFENEINEKAINDAVILTLACQRQGTKKVKTRAEVSGGGVKPWRQKGRGGARAGSTRTNVWVGGAVAFGPTNEKNYFQKVNKKQKRLALEYALAVKAQDGKIFAVDSISIESGKTKDAANIIKNLKAKDALIVKDLLDDKTLLAFRNLANCYVVDANEVNAYLVSTFSSVIIEKAALKTITKEG